MRSYDRWQRGTNVLERCPYCGRREYYARPGQRLGRCACKGRRTWDPETREAKCCTCGKVSPKLTARVREEYDTKQATIEGMAEHVQQAHRAHVIRDRMEEIEQQAAYLERHGKELDIHGEDAREYRALMREWWTLPPADTTEALSGHHQSARDNTGWLTRGRNKLIAKAKQTGQTVIVEGGCTYRLRLSA